MKDLSRSVSLLCPLCGNDQFESLDGEFETSESVPNEARYRCSDCGSIYTKGELIAENSEKLDGELKDLEKEAVKEIEKELKKAFGKWKM